MGQPWEGEAAHRKLEQLWKDTGARDWRAMWEGKVRAGETEKYLSASLQRAA